MDQKQFQIVIEACESAGFRPYAYSGRGMYGAKCLGFDCRNPVKAALELANSLTSEVEDLGALDDVLTDLASGAKWDSMGRDYVIYFEDVAWQGPESQEHEDDEEDEEE